MKKWIYLGVFILAAVAGAAGYQRFSAGSTADSGKEIDWRVLSEFDYITGNSTPELKKLAGTTVRIPGFMVPLEDDQRETTEFLLVPSPQACIHVPAPPPNQMVYVKMKKSVEIPVGPIWVSGDLNMVTKKSLYGEASFEMDGNSIEDYK